MDGAVCLERGCSACCHDTEMVLTEADVRRLRAAVAVVASDARDSDWFFESDDGYLQLLTRDAAPVPGMTGHPCWFLGDDGRCTVHDARPEGCRLYPVIWDVDADRAALDAEECPHTDAFRLPRSEADAVRRLVDRLERERAVRSKR